MGENFSYDVFLSHSSKENEEVRELAERLKRDGLRVWLDKWEIRPPENILAKIGQGLKQSRTLILFMSKSYFESKWAKFEAYTLIFRDPTNEQRRFIPLLIKNCIIPDILIQFAYIDWRKRKRSDEAYQKILAACGYDKKAVTRPPGKRELVIKKAKKLKGHKGNVLDVSVTPDGKKVVSGSTDKTLKVWDLGSGQCLRTFRGHDSSIFNVKVTPKGDFVVSGSDDGTLKLWNLKSGRCLVTFEEFPGVTYGIAITPDGKRLVSGSNDITLKLWDLQSGQCLKRIGDDNKFVGVWTVAVTPPDGSSVVASMENNNLEVWDLEKGQCLATFEGHTGIVNRVAITPDGSKVISGSNDNTLKVWDLVSGQCLGTFEGHSARVTGLAVTSDSKRVVSGSGDKTLRLWDLESRQCLATFEGHEGAVFGVSVTPDGKRVVSGSKDSTVRVWNLPEFEVSVEPSLSPRYTNAKVALVGESGVGKTGLGIRIVEKRWEKTDSTHGMNIWQLELPGMKASEMDREVWLWDFAGQPDYQLIHQLYMDETALALMVIDPQRDDPFDKLGHWEKALESAVKHNPAKLLVAGRCDRGGITVSSSKVEKYCNTHGYSGFVNTAAKTNEGCEKLKEMIAKNIPWDHLPWTATTRLFKTLKDAIIRIKEEKIALVRISELRQRLQLELKNELIEEKELRAVVGLLAGQGLVQKLDFGDFVLLQLGQINNYASAVIRCVREHTDEIGVIEEREVLEAEFDFKDMKRLNEADEKILLRAMVQTFLDRALCLREGTQLVFPSYFRRDRPDIPEHPNVFVTYSFEGMPEEIYTTLVVRLYYTSGFEKKELWKDAADFLTQAGKRVGFYMFKTGDNSAEIKVYFEPDVPEDTKVSFIKYIHEHLLKRAKKVSRLRSYVCPKCNTPLENKQALRRAQEKKRKEIFCVFCGDPVLLEDLIEEKFASDEFLHMVQEMDATAQSNIDFESLKLILVGHAYSMTGEAGQIFRPTPNSDLGIDAEIEFKNEKGQASGKRAYLQLKYWDYYTYKEEKDGKKVFKIKYPGLTKKWQSTKYPVMLVFRASDEEIYWMNVTDYLKNYFKRYRKQAEEIIFKGESFTALNVYRLRDKLFL